MFGIISKSCNRRPVFANPAPVGLIVPYNGHPESLPPSWEPFTAANDKFIIGAGSTYAVGATTAANAYSGSATTNTYADHTGTTLIDFTPESTSGVTGTTAGGSHSHVVSGSISNDPLNKSYGLIKCVTSSPIPSNAMMLARTTLANVTQVESAFTTQRLFRAVSSYANAGVESGSNTRTLTGTDTNGGSHTHGSLAAYAGGTGDAAWNAQLGSAGSHGHIWGFNTAADNTKRYILSAWTNANRRFDCVSNGIAMWEGTTAPTGWVLCNGLNGAPDMRDFFLAIGNTTIHGVGAGANTYSYVDNSVSTAGGHDHSDYIRGLLADIPNSGYHGDTAAAHTHTLSTFTGTETLRYYALTFIMKT